jgi:sulfite exporter TauE/SafE
VLLILLTLYVLVSGRAVTAPKSGTLLGRLVAKLVTSRRGSGVFTLGFLTGFLPCGVLYAAFARALTASSAAEGGTLMLAFWLGTVPLLFGLGFVTGGFFRLVGRRLASALIAVAMLGTGGWLVYKGGRGLASGHAHGHASHPPAPSDPAHHADR